MFRRIASGKIVFNPQTFLLTFIYSSITTIIVFRLIRWKTILELYRQVLDLYDKTNTQICRTKKFVLMFMISILLFEDVMILYSHFIIRAFPKEGFSTLILTFMAGPLPVIFIVLCPACVEFQYATLCVILKQALLKVNHDLEKLLQMGGNSNGNSLEKNRSARSTIIKVYKSVNREYGFEVFLLSNTLMLLAIYLINDLMMISNLMKKSVEEPFIRYKIAFNIHSLGAVICRLCWLGYESEQFIHEVSNVMGHSLKTKY